jgi:hypothetical protein
MQQAGTGERRRPTLFRCLSTALGVVVMAGGQAESTPQLRELRGPDPGAALCVNPPLNTAGGEIDISSSGEELAQRIRDGSPAAMP